MPGHSPPGDPITLLEAEPVLAPDDRHVALVSEPGVDLSGKAGECLCFDGKNRCDLIRRQVESADDRSSIIQQVLLELGVKYRRTYYFLDIRMPHR
jgi:hypothetical protein